jgi:hypothetical protein
VLLPGWLAAGVIVVAQEEITSRSELLPASLMYTFPAASTDTSAGSFISALVAGPPLPDSPWRPALRLIRGEPEMA